MADPLTVNPGNIINVYPSDSPSVKLENSCINNKVVYDYVERRNPDVAHLIFKDLPEPYSRYSHPEISLTDENTWVPSAVVAKVFENAKEILNDPDLAYKIGFEAITHRDFSYIAKFFISIFQSPQTLLDRMNHIQAQFNTTKIAEVVWATPRRAVVRLHWRQGEGLVKDFCEYNRGIYAAIPTLWGNPPAKIEESFCFFDGDPFCQFNIDYYGRTKGLRRITNFFSTKKTSILNALEEIEKDKSLLREKYEEVQQLNEELAQKIDRLKALNQASDLLVRFPETHTILKKTLTIVVNVLKIDRAFLMLVDDTKQNLIFSHGLGADPRIIENQLKDYKIPLGRQENILARAATRGKPVLIRDVNVAGLNLDNIIHKRFKPKSFVICPMVTEDGLLGLVAADRREFSPPIENADMDDLSSFVNQMAASLQKAKLQEEIEQNYINTVSALVQTIEKSDPYTRGHSERVSEISVELGRELGLDDTKLERMRVACLLHDVGKIGTEEIVRHKGSLTKDQYNIIKDHTLKGEEIVRPISFLRDYLHVIRNHHERWNGKGYPDGLKGDKIPIEAQIACVADAYDAITSKRAYEQANPPKEALRRIVQDEGTQFSPRVVEAFRSIYDKGILAKKINNLI